MINLVTVIIVLYANPHSLSDLPTSPSLDLSHSYTLNVSFTTSVF